MRQNSSPRVWILFATVLPLIGTGCGSSSGPARTVSYFQEHPQERESVFKRCADDPGTLGKSADCVNASRAEAIAGIGSFRQLPPMAFPKVPAPKVKKGSAPSGGNSGSQR